MKSNSENYNSYIPEGFSLYPFQHESISFVVKRTRALLADDPGLGKTISLITAVNYIGREEIKNRSPRVLVLCPKSITGNWKREIDKWADPGAINWKVMTWNILTRENRVKEIQDFKADIVIFDESHKGIKNWKSKTYKSFKKNIIPEVKRVWLSTATPASKSGLDYYPTLQILLPTLFEDMKAYAFQDQFCLKEKDEYSYNGYRYHGFNNAHILKEIFSKCCIRHKKEIVLPDLPPKVYSPYEIDVPEDIVADYLGMDVEMVAAIISSGGKLPGHLSDVMRATALAKMDDLVDIVDNYPSTESLVVFAWHREVVHEACRRLREAGRIVDTITGEITSETKRQSIVDNFQNKSINTVVLNMQSGGVGTTLTASQTAIYLEYPHSPIDLKQSEDRIHRIGSTGNKINIIRLMGRGTIDEKIFEVLDYRMREIEKVGV